MSNQYAPSLVKIVQSGWSRLYTIVCEQAATYQATKRPHMTSKDKNYDLRYSEWSLFLIIVIKTMINLGCATDPGPSSSR